MICSNRKTRVFDLHGDVKLYCTRQSENCCLAKLHPRLHIARAPMLIVLITLVFRMAFSTDFQSLCPYRLPSTYCTMPPFLSAHTSRTMMIVSKHAKNGITDRDSQESPTIIKRCFLSPSLLFLLIFNPTTLSIFKLLTV